MIPKVKSQLQYIQHQNILPAGSAISVVGEIALLVLLVNRNLLDVVAPFPVSRVGITLVL